MQMNTTLRQRRTAVLIACKNGEATIGNTVRSVADQADVYVVSDGSTDETARVARAAGAKVISRTTSGGKPDALRLGNRQARLSERYDYIGVLDDDTVVEPDYIEKIAARMDADAGIAAASGHIASVWEHDQRWNPFIAMRAFMYWSYQATIKRGQNALRVVNVICGANTLFRADVFAQLIEDDAPYAIDDMYWLAEIARRRLGRVEYVHRALSWTIDPHTFPTGTGRPCAGRGASSSRCAAIASACRSSATASARSASASRGSTSRTSHCSSTGSPTCWSRS